VSRSKRLRRVLDREMLPRVTLILFRGSDQVEQSIRQRSAPAQIIVAADELLVMNFVAFRKQYISHVAARFQDSAAVAGEVDFESAGVHVKFQRQLGGFQKFFREVVG